MRTATMRMSMAEVMVSLGSSENGHEKKRTMYFDYRLKGGEGGGIFGPQFYFVRVNGVGIAANRVRLQLVFFVVDGVSFGQHALMQNATNENAIRLLQVKHNVPFILHATQTRKNMVADSAQSWI